METTMTTQGDTHEIVVGLAEGMRIGFKAVNGTP